VRESHCVGADTLPDHVLGVHITNLRHQSRQFGLGLFGQFHQGKRTRGNIRSSRLSAYLTGTGFVSRNSADVRGAISPGQPLRSYHLPCLQARNMLRQRPGATLEVTEMQPFPP